MNVSYLAFLETHLNYLVARLFALEGDEQKEKKELFSKT